jgi:hypothetical protein
METAKVTARMAAKGNKLMSTPAITRTHECPGTTPLVLCSLYQDQAVAASPGPRAYSASFGRQLGQVESSDNFGQNICNQTYPSGPPPRGSHLRNGYFPTIFDKHLVM